MRPRAATSLVFCTLLVACGGGELTTEGGTAGAAGAAGGAGKGQGGTFASDVDDLLTVPKSCAYACPATDPCAEAEAPYACPAVAPWADVPHLAACGAWDGKPPQVTQGQCTATEPSGEAAKRPGLDPDHPGTRILPGGVRIRAAGAVWEMKDAIRGGMTASLTPLANGRVLTVDIGNRDHAVRVLDTTLVGAKDPVLGLWKAPSGLELAASAAASADRVWVATAEGKIEVLALSPEGALTHLPDQAIVLKTLDGKPLQASAIAQSKAGLLVGAVNDDRLLAVDLATGKVASSVSLGKTEVFAVAVHPQIPSRAYVSLWSSRKIVEVDLDAFTVARTFTVGQNPQGVSFLGSTHLVVANDYGESLSVVDLTAGSVSEVPLHDPSGLRGLDVSQVAVRGSRAYVTQAGVSAVAAFDVDSATSPPTFTLLGRFPTPWWPSGVAVDDQGDVLVTSLRGPGMGPFLLPETNDGDEQMRGALQRVPAPTKAELEAGDAAVTQATHVGEQPGAPKVVCPPGVMDFPVPATNTEGPSPRIERIVFVVRENKTFDSLLGDLPTLEGDPSLTLLPAKDMDTVFPNFRSLVRTFATNDNFYNLAVKSTQGHMWTTYGRATDFCERTWSSDARTVPLCGIGEVGRPEEGSLFEWLTKHQVNFDILGEIVGNGSGKVGGKNPVDTHYPGGPFQNIPYIDLEKACYTAARARGACDLGRLVYMTLPNDHTIGLSPKNPTPQVMLAANDEATGMLLDALSHDPLWPKTLVIVTEDDPQTGGDHVDYHRTPILFASPWVKRGYVSRTHVDVPSIHKLFAHILGLPYPNLTVKNAGLPLDLFTSTPDYGAYTYVPRKIPLACGTGASLAETRLTESWDFSHEDAQPGLGDQVRRVLRGRQLETLPPDLLRAVEAREARKAAGLPPLLDDDDD